MMQDPGIPITFRNKQATVRRVSFALNNVAVLEQPDTKRLKQACRVAGPVFESGVGLVQCMLIDPLFSGEGQRGALRYLLEFSERPNSRNG